MGIFPGKWEFSRENEKLCLNLSFVFAKKIIDIYHWYFTEDYNQTKIEKDLNNFLKKIKKDKKYSISKKDIILIESLKSDGIKIDNLRIVKNKKKKAKSQNFLYSIKIADFYHEDSAKNMVKRKEYQKLSPSEQDNLLNTELEKIKKMKKKQQNELIKKLEDKAKKDFEKRNKFNEVGH